MSSNKRRTARQTVNSAAWLEIDGDARLRRCRLVDISANGARLIVENVDDIPDSFNLLLSRFGRLQYRCNVVRKRGDEVGVEFLASPPTEAGDSVQAKSADASAALKSFA
jgi:PilZ domain